MGVYRGAGGTGDATQDGASQAVFAIEAKNAALASQVAAAASATSASTSATSANTSATNASTSATNAADSATSAAGYVVPSQTGNNGKYLKTNGTAVSWNTITVSATDISGTLAVANGGTGVTTSTGSGNNVLSTSPTLVTPALGTPSAIVLTNATSVPVNQATGTLPVANGGTGATTLAANNVLLGNGTTAFQVVAPSTSGNVLTSNGTTWTSAAAGGAFPAGTVILFYQSAAPTGWTQVTTLNDYDLRLVSGTGGTTGGTTAYSTVFANQTPTFTGSIGTLASGATTLSTAQMPGHTHSVTAVGGGANSFVNMGCGSMSGGASTLTTDAAGGGGSHSHALTGTPSGTVSAVTLNVRYANIIICSKN